MARLLRHAGDEVGAVEVEGELIGISGTIQEVREEAHRHVLGGVLRDGVQEPQSEAGKAEKLRAAKVEDGKNNCWP